MKLVKDNFGWSIVAQTVEGFALKVDQSYVSIMIDGKWVNDRWNYVQWNGVPYSVWQKAFELKTACSAQVRALQYVAPTLTRYREYRYERLCES